VAPDTDELLEARRAEKVKRVTWVVASVAAVLASAVLASAASAAPSWECRASAVWASVAGNSPIDPITSSSKPCASDATGLDNLPSPLGLPPDLLTAHTTSATTTATPAGAAPAGQSVSATGRVENLTLGLGAPAPPLTLAVADATASAVCQNGQPALSGSSQVVGASLGGQSVPLDQLAQQLSAALAPLNQVVDLEVDEQVRDASSLTQRALHLKVLTAAGTPVLEVVAGEARAGYDAGVCDSASGPGGPGGGGGGGGSTTGSGSNPSTSGSGGQGNSAANRAVLFNGVRGSTCARLRMRFTNGKRSIVSRLGTRKVIRGRIVNCKGKSIVRARIDVVHVVNGKRRLVKTGLRSRAGGALTLILPSNIKTRELRFEYRGNLRSTKVTSRSVLHITVRDRRGRTVR
jgi:hypothetical protein